MKNIVVIPIYKETLTASEAISLKQCFKILGSHTIVLVAPESLDISFYKKIIDDSLYIERFQDAFFENISGYNQLMLSQEFYKRFLQFDYLLIHQLDCYVFRDELDYWCSKGYDYIGSPWLFFDLSKMTLKDKLKLLLKQSLYPLFNSKLKGFQLYHKVGNGGFSLRKIRTFYDTLKKNESAVLPFIGNDTTSLYNEDIFWSLIASGIKKPHFTIATKFSLDMNATIGLEINNGILPFGCHAWSRKFHYWKNYITIDEAI
jgi:hypothetical protein